MSRCYPFPPPGYVRNRSRDEPRDEPKIVSIKEAEEKAKKEQKRKERKREKKEKKRKNRDRGAGESEKDSHKRRRKDKDVKDTKDDQKVDVFRKLKESETECLEKSSLTTEPELQTTSQNSCDSTVNSNGIPEQQQEQQQQLQLLDGRHNDSESSLRIRLAVRRQKDPEGRMTDQDQQQCPCPSRGTLDSAPPSTTKQPVHHPVHHPVHQVDRSCSTSATIPPENTLKPCEEKQKDPISRSSKQFKKHSKEKKTPSNTQEEAFQPSSLCRKCPPSIAQQFLNVVENWVPNTLSKDLTNSVDEECWYVKPSNQKFDKERCIQQLNRNSNSKLVVSSSMAAWPCARLLPEVDVYALPFTVPF